MVEAPLSCTNISQVLGDPVHSLIWAQGEAEIGPLRTYNWGLREGRTLENHPPRAQM